MQTVKRFPTTTGQSWLEMSSFKDHMFRPHTEIEDKYDYVIVGAGYGGYGVASHLAELCPDAKIAVFEALKLGNGDSGKNAGFIIDVPHNFGDQGNSTFDDNFMYYKLNTFARRIGTHYYKKALYTPGTLLVNPADVLRGLYSVLPENVSVFEECPVMGIANGSPAHVYLLNGKEITTKVVVVTGGPFIEEFGIVKHTFCPVLSYGAFTRQLNDREMHFFEGVKPWGCTAGHPAGTTVRFTTANRALSRTAARRSTSASPQPHRIRRDSPTPRHAIFVRNGFSYATSLTTSHQRIRRAIPKLRKAFEDRFPEIRNVNFEFIYGGMINMTMNFRPLLTRQHPNIYASASGEGAGVAKTTLLGHYLAEWICGIDSDALRFLQRIATPSHLPPEPLVTIGATARLMWEEFNAKKEI